VDLKRALLVFLLLPALLCAQSTEVKGLVEQYMAKSKTPGVTLAIIKDGKAEVHGFGLSDVENNVPARPDTVYQIGSVTKQFTATLVMRLVEEGKIRLDESILTYLSQLPADWKAVTVRHLLNHTSGIKSYTSTAGFSGLMIRPGKHEDLLKLITSEKLEFAPGERWAYNNSGYYLLGMIIEKVTGKTYRAVLKEQILQPLGMDHSDLYGWSEIVPNRARGYTAGRNADYIDMAWPFAAGSLLSSVPDLIKWEAAQGSEKLLKRDSWNLMWMPAKLNDGSVFPYGFGWALDKVPGSRVIEHNGGIPGFSAQINRYPDKNLAVILLTNALGGDVQALAGSIASVLDPSLAKPKPQAIEDKEPGLTAKLRRIFQDALSGKADPTDYDEQMQRLLFPDTIKEASKQLAAMGELSSFVLVEASEKDGTKQRIYSAMLGTTPVRVNISVDAKGKISGLLVRPG
jgi:CubicO group peptidase (beta-lactamase class C family)